MPMYLVLQGRKFIHAFMDLLKTKTNAEIRRKNWLEGCVNVFARSETLLIHEIKPPCLGLLPQPTEGLGLCS